MTGKIEKRALDVFETKSDKGKVYLVTHYQEFETIETAGNTIDEVAGREYWLTVNGLKVRQIDTKTYQIVSTNEIIRKV
jgi:hypothetical protein